MTERVLNFEGEGLIMIKGVLNLKGEVDYDQRGVEFERIMWEFDERIGYERRRDD